MCHYDNRREETTYVVKQHLSLNYECICKNKQCRMTGIDLLCLSGCDTARIRQTYHHTLKFLNSWISELKHLRHQYLRPVRGHLRNQKILSLFTANFKITGNCILCSDERHLLPKFKSMTWGQLCEETLKWPRDCKSAHRSVNAHITLMHIDTDHPNVSNTISTHTPASPQVSSNAAVKSNSFLMT